MKNKIVSLPISKVKFSEDTNSDLKKVSLRVCKAGEVPSHGMFIEKEALSLAEASIKNRPLLCAYEIDEEGNKVDFKGHEMEYKIVKDGKSLKLEIVYYEQPVGVIPESCNFRIEEEDEESWVVVDAYLYGEYCSDAVRILEENDGEKSVSMEINVLEAENCEDDGLLHIKKFSFTGVTLLGLDHPPAISGANISTFEQSETFALKFSELVGRVNKLVNEGGKEVGRDKIIEKFSALKGNEEFEKVILNMELSEEELEKALFSISVNDLESKIREELNKHKCVHTDYWGDTYEIRKYWLCDVLPEEKIVIAEDNEDYYKHYGIPYTIEGDSISLDMEAAKRYIRGDWRLYEEGSKEPEMNPVFEEIKSKETVKVEETKVKMEEIKNELDKVKVDFTELQTEKVTLEEEVAELRTFKSDFEKEKKEKEVSSILEKFEELKEIEGYEELVSTKFEISLEELEMKLKVFAFDNGVVLGKKKKFSKPEPTTVKTTIEDVNNEVEADPYGGLLNQYIK